DEAMFKHASIFALFSQMDRLMEECRAETTAISLILVFTIMYIFLALTSMSLVPVQDFGIIAAIGLVYAAFFTPIIVSRGILVQERVTRSGKQLLGGLRARK
ncbi:MAG: hypothetical protein U9O90_05885, partial [Euryarchaeota archaeon]|nr:hypothetical protein [Euryarchaeota archaeon]